MLLEKIASGAIDATISVEVVQEILHRFNSLRQSESGVQLARKTMTIFHPILPVEAPDMRLATDLLEQYPTISSRDAVHAAVALNNGIAQVISTDTDFDAVKEITRVSPTRLTE